MGATGIFVAKTSKQGQPLEYFTTVRMATAEFSIAKPDIIPYFLEFYPHLELYPHLVKVVKVGGEKLM